MEKTLPEQIHWANVKFRLTLKPHARSLSTTGDSTGPVMMYEVEGLRVSIANFRAEEQIPVWQIGGHVMGRPVKWTGAFKSPEDALAQLQREIDSDTADSRFWSSSTKSTSRIMVARRHLCDDGVAPD